MVKSPSAQAINIIGNSNRFFPRHLFYNIFKKNNLFYPIFNVIEGMYFRAFTLVEVVVEEIDVNEIFH